jgi:putative ABC transport system permease protein
MSYLFSFAVRNLLRYTRRTVLTFSLLAISGLLFLTMQGWFDGLDDVTLKNTIAFKTGHFQARLATYDEDAPFSTSNLFPVTPAIASALDGSKHVKGWTPRVTFLAQADNGHDSWPCVVTGFDPATDSRVFVLTNGILKGGKIDPNGVLVGRSLAKDLGVGVGDPFFLTVRSAAGQIDSVELNVSGLLSTGDPLVDSGGAFLPIATAYRFLGTNLVSEIGILCDSLEKSGSYRAEIEKNLPGMKLWSYQELAGDILQLSRTKRSFLNFLVFFLVIIGVVGIINTMLMSVYEKTREIGTLKALGFRDRDVQRIFLIEGFLIGLIGGLGGVILGCLSNAYFVYVGMDLRLFFSKGTDIASMGVPDVMYSIWNIGAIIGTFIVSLVASTLASWYPAKKAVEMQAAECLRTI